MKVLGILQNLWVKDPARVKEMMERHGRIAILQKLLFYGGLTGKRLMEGFGEEWCQRIVWEEASPEIGGHSGSKFKADIKHVQSVIDLVKPDIVLAFGSIANGALTEISKDEISRSKYKDIICYNIPHPAARVVAASKIITDFRQCKRWLDEQEQRMKETIA